MSQYVLEPLSVDEINAFLPVGFVESFGAYIKRSIANDADYYAETDQNIMPNKGTLEFRIAKLLGGKHIGQGSSPVDIQFGDKFIDVKSITTRGEVSMIQNFEGIGNSLDKEIKTEEQSALASKWVLHWLSKYNTLTSTNIYDLFIVTDKNNIYLAILKHNTIDVSQIAQNIDASFMRGSTKAILIKNYVIDVQYGNCKLYKSKKRLELRINIRAVPHIKIPILE